MPYRASTRSIPLLVACAFAAFASAAHSRLVFVGPATDPDCDYHTIQDAIDAWAVSTDTEYVDVFIANAVSWTSVALQIPTPAASEGIGLRGDYAGCRLAGATGRARLDGAGNGGAPVIDVEGTVAGEERRVVVNLGSLEITGGDRGTGHGGGVRARGNLVVTLFESDVHGNRAVKGGGVYAEGTAVGQPQLVLASNRSPVAARDNHAELDGGGYYCENATLYCDRYCLVEQNTAGRNGGGIAGLACGVAIYASPSAPDGTTDFGLRANSAGGDGGGAWVSGGYFGLVGDAPRKPAPVSGNVAVGDGGGVFLTGLGSSSVTLRGLQFDDNGAGGSGGALYADSGFIQGYTALTGACGGDSAGCQRFRDNHAAVAGGAIALTGTASLLMSDALFAGNVAARGSVLQLAGTGTGAVLANVHVAGNHGAAELVHSAGAYADLRYVTIADNGSDDTALLRFSAASSFAATNSILHDDNGAGSGAIIDAPAGTGLFLDCVLVHDDSGLAGEPGVSNLVVADPEWDASGLFPAGLYVPGPSSPAVDACGPGSGMVPDLLGGERPQDLPKPDGAGPFDMGAIERKPDRVFADGFDPA